MNLHHVLPLHPVAEFFRRSFGSRLSRIAALAGVAILCIPTGMQASTFKRITIDGNFADWAGVAPAYQDPQENPNATDIKDVYVAHDEAFIYVRFSLHQAADPFTARNNFFINADGDSSTGFGGGRGSEMLIQSGAGYQEKNRGFNEGGITGLGWQAAPTGAAKDFEFRFSRAATYASDGEPVFASDLIGLYLEAETPTFARVEDAPDTGFIEYVLTPPPPVYPSGSLTLISQSETSWSFNDSGTDLGTAWSDPASDPSGQPGWTSGKGLFGYAPNAAVYAAPIQTGLQAGRTTYYFRTAFQWDYDPAGVVIQADVSLSDGAVIYLNGTEVRRVRVNERPVNYLSPASGGPATPGQIELLTLPPESLLIGANVLAAEVHQSAGDTADLVFGLKLTASDSAPVLITNPNQPADREVVEGDSTIFTVEASGTAPIQYQWFKGSDPIPGATSASYSIPVVLQQDAGLYHVELSNPLTTRLESRVARLTTRAVPVAITNPDLPQDLTLLEGRTATFSVEASGSAIVSYQWYKNGQPIANATASTYTIANLLSGDSGEYYAVVSNRLTPTATSRRATLVVSSDSQAPAIVGVSGSAAQLTVTYNEPVDSVTALNPANYSIEPALTISGGVLDASNPARVILTTAAQSLGTQYTLTVQSVRDLFGNGLAAPVQVPFLSTIVVDGSFDDWAGVTPLVTDDQDSTESSDYSELYVFNDENWIYFRIVLHSDATWPTSFFYNNIFIDSDNDPVTGYHPFGGMGSELLIQGGAGYQEKNGVFNEGGIDGLGWEIAPTGVASAFECRFSRHATYASDGLKVFRHSGFNVVLEAENTSYVAKDFAPNSGTAHFTFQPESLDPVKLQFVEGQWTLSWVGDGVLQSRESLTEGDWSDEPDQTNPQPLVTEVGNRYYRLLRP
ncbi:MAG: hypothetical protein JNN07_25980 [Verrucomicrobiales bacterium]|nr:hypothetical protein [Verrucomicrobiales bacterium]